MGHFDYRPDQGRLSWSEGLYLIFGFRPGEVVPTLALMSSHQHPDDRPGWDAAIAGATSDGRPFSRWHRIVDARTRTRTLLTVVEGTTGLADGPRLRGWVTDVTEQLRQDRAQEVAAAVTTSAATRATIDQAKGVLMATMDIDETDAFDLLRWYSSYTNTKLRDIASMLLARLADPEQATAPPRQRLSAILTALSGGRRPPVSSKAANWAAPDAPADQAEAMQHIPDELMTRTLVHAIAAAGVSISIADASLPDWPLVYVNRAFEQLTGYSGKEMLGRNCRFMQGEQTDPAHPAAIRHALEAGQEIRLVLRNYRRDGAPFWNELHLSAVAGVSGRITHYIGYQSDVSERVEREQQLERLAFSDPATSLPNTAAAIRHLAALAGAGASIDVLHLSLSGLPADQSTARSALIAAGERLGDLLPAGTLLAKLSDESFLAVLPEPDADTADVVTAAFASPFDIERLSLMLAVRITRARWPGGADSPEALLDSLQQRR